MNKVANMLKEEIKKECLENPALFADVAAAAGNTPSGTLQMLQRNSSKTLRSVEVVEAIIKHTGKTQEEILEPVTA